MGYIMKSLTSLTLTALAVAGLTVVPPVFQSGAIAATAQAAHAGSAKRHRGRRAACRPTGMYFGGKAVCAYSTPYTYRVDPDGYTTLLWPR